MQKIGLTLGLSIVICLTAIYVLGGRLNAGAVSLLFILSISLAELIRRSLAWFWRRWGQS
jgi:hypothetical protein